MSRRLQGAKEWPPHVKHFLEEIRNQAGVGYGASIDHVLAAFAAVPREAHVRPGPWTLRSPRYGQATFKTPDADPRRLYHNVLVSLDDEKKINIGEPALWLRTLLAARIEPECCVMQVGAGSGYYTAILSRLVGDDGSVLAFEVDEDLATLATSALADWPNVDLRSGSALDEPLADDPPVDLLLSFAGVSLVPDAWTRRLSPKGRMMLPVTGERGWGAMVEFVRTAHGFVGTTCGACGFIPCIGARDPVAEKAIDAAFRDQSRLNGWSFELTHEGMLRV